LHPDKGEGVGWSRASDGDASVVDELVNLLLLSLGKGVKGVRRCEKERIGEESEALAHCRRKILLRIPVTERNFGERLLHGRSMMSRKIKGG
jgi:hypothetical protein